jgi:hypothetical protein
MERIPVRAYVWGASETGIKKAVDRAGRTFWSLAEVNRLTGLSCPFDTDDPHAIAADRDDDWAYAVYRSSGG